MKQAKAAGWQMLTPAHQDIALIGASSLAAWLVIERTDTCDRVFDWIAANPDYEVDSLLLAFLLAAIGIAVFAWRRYRELQQANSARELAERDYQTLAFHDPLTGLPNRRALSDCLTEAHAAGQDHHLLMIDLDRFKGVNDLHGHASGDRLLRLVARRIADLLGEGQRAFRLGGDEFAVVLSGGDRGVGSADKVAERLVAALEKPFDDGGLVHHIGASAGLANSPEDGAEPTGLMRAADVALYAAKDAGRGQYRRYESGMAQALQRRARIESEMRSGLARGEFVPFFQPIVSLNGGQVAGYEVLSRWQRSDGDEIGPECFIPIADECGLINELTLSVLGQACRIARDWESQHVIEFNFSPNQLRDPWLSERVLATLTDCGFPPQRLGIEITEDAIIADEESTRRVVESFKNLGCKISLDDFGTGYSSLHHLRSLPFDRIKIDRSFVRDMENAHDGNALQIVKAIVGLAHSLDLVVTAEGIESPATAAKLRKLGCDSGQGFHFGAPAAWEGPVPDLPVPLRA